MAEENQNIGHGNYQPAPPTITTTPREEPAATETKEPAAGGGVFEYLRKKKEEYLPTAASPAPTTTTTNDEPEVKSRGMFDFLKTKTDGEENKEMAGNGYQPAAPSTTTHEEESEIKDRGTLEENVVPEETHGYQQPAAHDTTTTTYDEPETKDRGMLDFLGKKKEEEEVVPEETRGNYSQPAAPDTTTTYDEPETKDRGMLDFLGKKKEEVVPEEAPGNYQEPAAPVTTTYDEPETKDRGMLDFLGKKKEEVLPTTDHGYSQPAAPATTDEEESTIKGRGMLGSDFSGSQGVFGSSGEKKEEEEVVPTTDHGYRQPASPATIDDEESEIKGRGMLGSDFSGNQGIPQGGRQGMLGTTHDDESENKDQGMIGFSGGKKDEEEVIPSTDHGYRQPAATIDDEESEIGRGMLGSDFSGNQGIPQGGRQGMLGTTHDDESENKDRGVLDFSGKNKEEDQEKLVPEETRGYQPVAPTTHDESEIKDRGMLGFLGKKNENEREENIEMAEEQIPISHGNQPAAPATNEESEIKDRGMFGFLGKKKEEEEVVPTTTHDLEKDDEKKQHSSLLDKLQGSNNANSSSEEEVEENGEKIRRKKKKGLKEKIHEKISGGDNKVEEEPEKKINYFHEEKCDDATHTHPEQKKGLIEKIKGKLHKKSAEDQGTTQSFGAPAAPAGHPVSIDQNEYASPTDGEETKEKKGFLEKIKDKLPGHHKSVSNEEKKNTSTNY